MTHGLDGLGITVSTEFGMGEDSLWFPVSDILSIQKSHIWIPALLKPHKCIPGAQFFIFKWGVFPIITAFYLPVVQSRVKTGGEDDRHPGVNKSNFENGNPHIQIWKIWASGMHLWDFKRAGIHIWDFWMEQSIWVCTCVATGNKSNKCFDKIFSLRFWN